MASFWHMQIASVSTCHVVGLECHPKSCVLKAWPSEPRCLEQALGRDWLMRGLAHGGFGPINGSIDRWWIKIWHYQEVVDTRCWGLVAGSRPVVAHPGRALSSLAPSRPSSPLPSCHGVSGFPPGPPAPSPAPTRLHSTVAIPGAAASETLSLSRSLYAVFLKCFILAVKHRLTSQGPLLSKVMVLGT